MEVLTKRICLGRSLIDDIFDEPTSVPMEKTVMNTNSVGIDIFSDASFMSAPTEASSQAQKQVDLFASQPAMAPAAPPTVDFFATTDPIVQSDNDICYSSKEPAKNPTDDGSSDFFGSFTSDSDSASKEPAQSPMNDESLNNMKPKPSQESKAPQKKDTFQVKSGIWADSLSRGIIDLNISAPTKVSLVDVGILGGLSDVDKRERTSNFSLYWESNGHRFRTRGLVQAPIGCSPDIHKPHFRMFDYREVLIECPASMKIKWANLIASSSATTMLLQNNGPEKMARITPLPVASTPPIPHLLLVTATATVKM
ncbi:hypothetical protein V6N12_007126 [Hibiscus sabdariffa]|uniref:Uncharacterized protein n=1 Tax=Hibiscus sabdariffa TaxID=183260 RepID=A0ABR2F0W0_9ROSI